MKISACSSTAARMILSLALVLLAVTPLARAQTARFTTLHNFGTGADGELPEAGLLLGQDGNYYGTTGYGGTNRVGTIFRLTPAGVCTVLVSLDAPDANADNQDGTNPTAPLIQDAAGNLYGTIIAGGATNDGTLFTATTAGGFTTLHDFGSQQPGFTDGAFPNGGLAFLPDGTVGGVAENGGDSNSDGVVFFFGGESGFSALDLGGDTGMFPLGSLAVAPSGFIYGVCNEGGGGNVGTIYGILGGGAAGPLFPIYQFSATDTNHVNVEGASPAAGPIVARDGNLYGTANDGGPNANGTVWQFVFDGSLTTGTIHVLHAFTGTDGSGPAAPLVQGSDGSFYGTTSFGGANGTGVVFRVTATGVYTVLHGFSAVSNGANADGSNPEAGLTEVRPGSFVGTASDGGTNNAGTAFELDVAPLITSAATAAGNLGSAFSYQITAADGPGSYSVGGLGDGLTFNAATGLIAGTPTATGTLHLTVSASNDVGTASQAVTVTIKGPVPAVTGGSASAVAGQSFEYSITATNNPTSYGVQGLPAGLSVSSTNGMISGTPTKAGKYTLTLNVYNANGKGSATLILTIAVPAPVVTGGTASGKVGTAFSYQITATNSPTTYGAQGLPGGLALNATTGAITGAPTKAGTYPLTLNAYNATGKGSATLTLTVTVAGPPVVTGGTASGKAGVAFSYQIAATNSPTSYGVQGLPGGLAVNATTGAITGTPTKAGTFTLTLNAYNSAGKGSATLTLTVGA